MKYALLVLLVCLMSCAGLETHELTATDAVKQHPVEDTRQSDSKAHHEQINSNKSLAGDLHLISTSGPFSFLALKGNVVILFFGYTHCPDVCPRDMSFLARVYAGFSSKAQARLKVLFVSVDPERDNVKAMKDFVQYFNSKFIGVTGSLHDIKILAKRFNVHFKKQFIKGSTSEYGMEHTANIYLLDSQGRISVVLPNGISDLALHQAIQYLLDELKS